MRILDLCTGPGSIALLLSSLLNEKIPHQIVGVDISKRALSVAKESLRHNVQKGFLGYEPPIKFVHGDVLNPDTTTLFADIGKAFRSLDTKGVEDQSQEPQLEKQRQRQQYCQQIDLVISNPPYISPKAIWRDTGRSVRRYEPRLALVPPSDQVDHRSVDYVAQEDLFYPQIGRIAQHLRAKGIVVEASGWEQARRVEKMYNENELRGTTAWQDHAGHGRIVVAWNKSTSPGGHDDWFWLDNS